MSATEPQRETTTGIRTGALVLLAIGLALGSAGLGALAWSVARGPSIGVQEVVEVRTTPDVLVAVRDLSRLESASYHVERVIEMTRTQRAIFGLLEAEDSILLVAAADIVAGVDLAELGPRDVVVDHAASRATITLPPARVLSTALDGEHTFVHSRRTDMLARRREDLETEARREAERTLEAHAIETGILDRARANAARTIESLVRSLGIQHVEVRFSDGP